MKDLKPDRIMLAHGSGGQMSHKLIEEIFKPAWDNPWQAAMLDGAVLDLPPGKVALSTDSFVITPLIFPGGDIGKLAICGTVNDLVACGADPLYLTAAFIIEEGFSIEKLRNIVLSMANCAKTSGIHLVCGDTKVVEKGSADGLFINTTGIGVIPTGINYSPKQIKAEDIVIISGNIGDHGLAVLAQREGLKFNTSAISDCAPLHEIGSKLVPYGPAVRCLRDPTRGGLATVLNELAGQAGLGMVISENRLPISATVNGACAMLGLDPLYMANEGKMVIISSPDAADAIISDLRQLEAAAQAQIIGKVIEQPAGTVLLETELGSARILPMLEGEHLPRIC